MDSIHKGERCVGEWHTEHIFPFTPSKIIRPWHGFGVVDEARGNEVKRR